MARELFDASEILDVAALMPPEQRAACFRCTPPLTRAFLAEASAYQREPWLRCFQHAKLDALFYSLAFWRELLRKLRDEIACREVLLYGPFSLSALGPQELVDVDILETLLALPPGAAARSWRFSWRAGFRKVAGALGWAVNRWARLLATSPSMVRTVAGASGRLLVCGLQHTDRLVQAALVRELDRRGCDYLWLTPMEEGLPLTEDERRLDEISGNQGHPAETPVRDVAASRWRWEQCAKWSRHHLQQRVADILGRILEPGWSRHALLALAGVVLRGDPDLRLTYLGVDELLSRCAPSVVVGNSQWDLMLLVREWTRRQGVPFVQFPHGIDVYLMLDHRWDADRIAVSGEAARKQLVTQRPEWSERVVVVGAMHFAIQAEGWGNDGRPVPPEDGPWRALFLLGGTRPYLMPYAHTEFERDVRALAWTIHRAGGELHLRCHPRHSDHVNFELLVEELRREDVPVHLANRFQSLNAALEVSQYVLVESWSGALVMALYARRPVVAWMPRVGTPDFDRCLSSLPLVARNAKDVARLTIALRSSPDMLDEVLLKQDAILEYHIRNPRSPSWSRAADIVMEEIARAKQAV